MEITHETAKFQLKRKKKKMGPFSEETGNRGILLVIGHKDQRVEMLRGLGRGLLCNCIRLLDVQDHMVI